MSELVKQRMVGVAVLLLMMVVIMPWMLDHTDIDYPTREHLVTEVLPSSMPSVPSISKEVNQVEVAKAEQATEEEPLALHQQTKVKVMMPQEQKGTWYAQVGSFYNKINADNFVLTLIDATRESKVVRYVKQDKPLYRVYLGPFLTKAKALAEAKPWAKGRSTVAMEMKG